LSVLFQFNFTMCDWLAVESVRKQTTVTGQHTDVCHTVAPITYTVETLNHAQSINPCLSWDQWQTTMAPTVSSHQPINLTVSCVTRYSDYRHG